MLAEEGAIIEFNCHNFVFSDHHSSISYGISFKSAWDGFQIPTYPCFLGGPETFVIGNDPGHVFLSEKSSHTTGVEDFCISVSEVSDNNAVRRKDKYSVLLV